jgi:hypothetical protein
MWSAAFLISLLPLVVAKDFRILHRIHNPLAPVPSPFSERGILSNKPSIPLLVASASLGDDLLQFAETAQNLNGAFYQVALEREGDEHQGQWSISSVKAVRAFQSIIFRRTYDCRPAQSAICPKARRKPSSSIKQVMPNLLLWTTLFRPSHMTGLVPKQKQAPVLMNSVKRSTRLYQSVPRDFRHCTII